MNFTKRIFRPNPRPRTPETPPISHPVGYEILSEGTNPVIADIVFVHGLRGHRLNTWTKNDICWPRDLLPREQALSNVRILTFGYDSRVIDFGGHASQNNIFQHAISLLNGLCRKRDDTNRPIIFIAHSLGGIVVKDAIHYSDYHRRTKPDLATIFDATRGIIFLGTPHRGSGVTTLPKLVATIIQAVQDVNVELIRDVEMNSQTLDRIADGFSQILDRRTFTVFSFEEELAMRGGTKVAELGSILIGDAHERRDTIHANHVEMVKFSNTTDDGYEKVLYAIKMLLKEKHKATEREVGGASVTLEDTTYYDVPGLHVPKYVERKKLSSRLEKLFSNGSNGSTPCLRTVVLLGMGGAGKTQVALRFCRQMKQNGRFRGIFWLDASSRNALESSMLAICKRLLPGRLVDNPRDGVSLVTTTLSDWMNPWMLVFDNLDNLEDFPDIVRFFPNSGSGCILITSRSASSKDLGEVIEIEQMEKDEGLELLLSGSQTVANDVAAEKILARLEYLPLAIALVRAYLSKQKLSLVDFEEGYERRKANFMAETPRVWQYRRVLHGNPETPLNLLTTWELSFKLLDDEMDDGRLGDVLTLFAFLHPVGIREGLFRRDIGDPELATSPMAMFEENGRWNHMKFEQAVICMEEHSLVRFSRQDGDELVLSLHSMVSEWLRLRLEKGRLLTSLKTAALHLGNYVESMNLEYIYRQEALLHVDSICRLVEGESEIEYASDNFLEIYNTFGSFYRDHCRLEDAERMYERALVGYEKALGADHSSTLGTVNNLGLLYVDQGRFANAERMYDHALAGKERVLGRDDTSTLDTVNNLGILYRRLGRFADAERMYDRALAGRERELGRDHTSTLDTVNSLGILYERTGRLADAERMYERALAGTEKALGQDHTSTLGMVHNLGILYERTGRLVDAERMYERALAGYGKALGQDHTSTLGTVNNLGLLYVYQGRFADAERMYDRALTGKEMALGRDHASTLSTVNNLGILYETTERFSDAERMYERALAGKEKALGQDHTSFLDSVYNLGILYIRTGRLADAERMFGRALSGYEKSLGRSHTSTLDIVRGLEHVYRSQGRLGDAESLMKEYHLS